MFKPIEIFDLDFRQKWMEKNNIIDSMLSIPPQINANVYKLWEDWTKNDNLTWQQRIDLINKYKQDEWAARLELQKNNNLARKFNRQIFLDSADKKKTCNEALEWYDKIFSRQYWDSGFDSLCHLGLIHNYDEYYGIFKDEMIYFNPEDYKRFKKSIRY